jgi:hypothetical protein
MSKPPTVAVGGRVPLAVRDTLAAKAEAENTTIGKIITKAAIAIAKRYVAPKGPC